MKYHSLPISKTYRRFVALAGKVQRLLDRGEFQHLSAEQQQRLAGRLKQLYRRLSGAFSQGRLRKILASAALVLGLGAGSVQAQEFAPFARNPFGLGFNQLAFITFADLDNDGDQDLMSIQYDYDAEAPGFAYYENTGTAQSPAFGAPQANPFGLSIGDFLTTPYLVDIDDDGDKDLFAGTYDPGQFLYYENQGTAENPSFASLVVNPFGLQSSVYYMAPTFADLDNDGDFDLLGTTYDIASEKTQYRYQENTGSANAPQFAPAIDNPFGMANNNLYVIIPAIGDLDMDGDYDVITGGSPVNYDDPAFVEYLENTGSPESPSFANSVVNPFGISFPDAAYLTIPALVDIDDDGDLDLFVSGYSYDEASGESGVDVWYFENTAVVNSTQEPLQPASLKVFPTVAGSFLNWQLALSESLPQLQMEAFAGDGRRVKQWRVDGLPGQQQGQLDVGGLPSGLYQLRLSDGNGQMLAQERFVVR